MYFFRSFDSTNFSIIKSLSSCWTKSFSVNKILTSLSFCSFTVDLWKLFTRLRALKDRSPLAFATAMHSNIRKATSILGKVVSILFFLCTEAFWGQFFRFLRFEIFIFEIAVRIGRYDIMVLIVFDFSVDIVHKVFEVNTFVRKLFI